MLMQSDEGPLISSLVVREMDFAVWTPLAKGITDSFLFSRLRRCPENCPYTADTGKPKEELSYFNSGLLVIHPSNTEFERLKAALDRIENLAKYVFADQDFLNQVYAGRWVCLPYTYNALRPLITAHPNMWRDEDVRIVHYIFKKPWLDLDWMARSEEENRKQEFYTVNSWWFQAYEKANLN